MRKSIIALLIVGLIGVLGCMPSSNTQTRSYTPVPNTVQGQDAQNTYETYREPPVDVTWISPGKIKVGNFYPGARAEWELQIHNGDDTRAMYAVAYRYPDRVESGYSFPQPEAQQWVAIADMSPILMPKETRNILIVIELPEDAIVASTNWEFWLSVRDVTQTGQVQTELCQRWLVSMRE